MWFGFEESIKKCISEINGFIGYAITPWPGVANKLNEMGYKVVRYEEREACLPSYKIYKGNKNVSLNGYFLSIFGENFFIESEYAKDPKGFRYISAVCHALKLRYNDVFEYISENIEESECKVLMNEYEIHSSETGVVTISAEKIHIVRLYRW